MDSKELWIKQADKTAEILGGKFNEDFNEGISVGFLQGILYYKASLREEIEKEIKAMPKFEDRSLGQDAFVIGLDKALQFIDTVKPIKV